MDIYEMISNPEFFRENRIWAHAEMDTYLPDGRSNRFLNLNGDWHFAYAENPDLVPEGFERDDYDCHGWDTLKVPGHIQLQGYDRPQYSNTAYPWDGREEVAIGEVPRKFNPTGCYVKYFTLSEEDLRHGIRLSMQGVESCGILWVNGAYVGYMENSFDPSEFDITGYVRSGENKLAVEVIKWCAGSWCEDQDFFRFSGIYRSVYLYSVPARHIEDVKLRPLLSEDFGEGTLQVEVRVSGGAYRLRYGLYEIGDASRTETDYERMNDDNLVAFGESSDVEFSFRLSRPLLWSAEKPNLYRVKFTLMDEEGREMESLTQNVGFRRFELKDGLMLINGRRIVFKGVNRHEFSCHTGRAVSDEEILWDVRTMKRSNINAIRTCHYPDDVRIYDLCDRYGLYLIAENNMETHGTWCTGDYEQKVKNAIPGDRPEWEELLLDRVNSCYQRDKNHPSILIWSIGNESFGGPVISHMSEKFRKLDPDRLVHYEGIFNDRRFPDSSDMESQMYPSAAGISAFLKKNPGKPFICCEYCHTMGNSGGGMHKYTDLTDTEPRYQGGFIWDFIDQALDTTDMYGEPYLGWGGDFDDRPTNYDFSGDGIVYANRKLSPKMQEVRFNYQNIGIEIKDIHILIRNKNLFTDLSEYSFTALLYREGTLLRTMMLDVSCPPLDEVRLPMPFRAEDRAGDGEYYIRVSAAPRASYIWADGAQEVAFGEHIYSDSRRAEAKHPAGKFEIVHGLENLGVRGEDFSLIINPYMGGLTSYVYKGREYINVMPRMNFWRAPTANDDGNGMAFEYAQWKIAGPYADHRRGNFFVKGPRIREEEDHLKITYERYLPTSPQAKVKMSYIVTADGSVTLRMKYKPVKGLPDMPEFGFLFELDGRLSNVRWYGLGPEETYADRKRGGKLGIYERSVPDMMAAYLKVQECGSHEDVRYLEVFDENGLGLRFTAKDRMSASALPYTPEELENARHAYNLPKSRRTIVRTALGQMGVGGDNSWGAPVHPEYHLDVRKPLEFSVTMKGIG